MKAMLFGGPCHREVVEFGGNRFIKKIALTPFDRPEEWLEAVYIWEHAKRPGESSYEFIGLFSGYFNQKGQKVNKHGLRVETPT